MGTALDRVVRALEEAGMNGRGADWTCPSHEDRNPSLHVKQIREGGVGIKCHAGCPPEDIMAALGLAMSDLYDELPKEVARYRYYDHDGVVYHKVRFEPKTFRWEPSLNGHKMPLYRVEEALELPGPIYLIESERDVDSLLDMKVAATCMPGGAGDWRQDYADALRGHDIIIIADRDEAGIKHAMKILPSLGGARVVQSKTLGDHDDVGDHLAAGFTLDELVPLRPENEISRNYTPINWRKAWSEVDSDVKWLVDPVVERGTVVALFGPPGHGKSLVCLSICLQIVKAGEVVLMIDDENRVADLVRRLRAFGCTPEELDNLVTFSFAQLPALDTVEGGQHLAALADVYKPSLITLDTISRLVAGDENLASTYLNLYRCTLAPLKGRDIATLRLDHSGKDLNKGQRGSSAKAGDADSIWKLTRENEDGNFIILEREKSRTGRGEPMVILQKWDDPLRFDWDACSKLVDAGVIELSKWLDRHRVPLDWGRDRVRHEHSNVAASNAKLSAALKYRRDQAKMSGSGDGQRDRW